MAADLLKDRRVLIASIAAVAAVIIAIAAIVVANTAGSTTSKSAPCRIDSTGISGNCFGQPQKEEDAWWAGATAQTVYAFVGLAASASGGGYALLRVKNRRKRLAAHIHAVDATLATNKANPQNGTRALTKLRRDIRDDFHAGRLDDGHFLELDKRATSAILKLRMLDLDTRFPTLSPAIRSQIVTLISDGTVSDAEVGLVRNAMGTHLMLGRVRDELLGLLEEWAGQDAPPTEPALAVPAGDAGVVAKPNEH